MEMDLEAYYRRIGIAPVAPDLAGLTALHRAQAYAIPYEGLDVQFGQWLDLDPARIFDKLVRRGRGGWCYENNGLLGWALAEAGFDVMRVTAGVHRKLRGDGIIGNHLTLIVTLPEGRYLCDLGLGDGLRAPIPLEEGVHHDGPLTFQLERLDDGYWRFWNTPGAEPATFDFRDEPADEERFEILCHRLQTDPESHFILNAECVRMYPERTVTLLGRVLRRSGPEGLQKTLLNAPEEMAAVLAQEFGITGLDTAKIWPRILARHTQLFGDT